MVLIPKMGKIGYYLGEREEKIHQALEDSEESFIFQRK
jgi:hypothetical protein